VFGSFLALTLGLLMLGQFVVGEDATAPPSSEPQQIPCKTTVDCLQVVSVVCGFELSCTKTQCLIIVLFVARRGSLCIYEVRIRSMQKFEGIYCSFVLRFHETHLLNVCLFCCIKDFLR